MRHATHGLTLLGLTLVAAVGYFGLHAVVPAPPAGAPDAARQAPALPRPLLGVAINAHHISDLSVYLEGVDAIAELGANALVVVTPMFQEFVDSSEIRFLPDRCPTDEQLEAILKRAEQRGLFCTLLPIVLIEHPGEKDWRGLIDPKHPDRWWASYERLTDRFLGIAQAGGVDAYSVGSELNSMEPEIDRWTRLIDRARATLHCEVTYTANWDRYHKVTFWELVDFMSVSAYFELARNEPDAPLRTLIRAWGRERDKLLRFCRRQDRRLVLQEMGYPSLPWAAAHPWNYVADPGTAADHDAQARCYRAFFGAWSTELVRPDTRIAGFHCYAWDPYHRGEANDTGYGFRGKPAMKVIREGFANIRRATQR